MKSYGICLVVVFVVASFFCYPWLVAGNKISLDISKFFSATVSASEENPQGLRYQKMLEKLQSIKKGDLVIIDNEPPFDYVCKVVSVIREKEKIYLAVEGGVILDYPMEDVAGFIGDVIYAEEVRFQEVNEKYLNPSRLRR